MDVEQEIVMRDHNGEFQIVDPPNLSFEEAEGESAAERSEEESVYSCSGYEGEVLILYSGETALDGYGQRSPEG